VPHEAYADSVLRELALRAPTPSSGPLESVFFGGGTPSLWEPAQLGRVLQAILRSFEAVSPDVEITVECNPSSLDAAKAAALRDVGVNRLSIGVQSLDDQRLRFLGRLHDQRLAIDAVRSALSEMPRVSADLMFGMPGQAPRDFLDEVEHLLELPLEHLSVYALTIEPQTQFGELHRKGKLPVAKEDAYADTFLETEALLAERGFDHYEVSNYAKPSQTSRHNQHYWRGGDYLGLGCAAVGCVDGRRYRNHPKPIDYDRWSLTAQRVSELETESELLGPQERVREALMLGLRTNEGVDLAALRERAGVDPRTGRERAIERQQERGNLAFAGERMNVPRSRWLQLDSIVSELF
jgi:oxygen-independent coproporphyrinogen-3 oxidase